MLSKLELRKLQNILMFCLIDAETTEERNGLIILINHNEEIFEKKYGYRIISIKKIE